MSSSILPHPLVLPYEGVAKDKGFHDEAQMAYFLKDGWTVDPTGTFLEKEGVNAVIVQFKYSVVFLVKIRQMLWDGDTPVRPRYPQESNIMYPCQTIPEEDQWAVLRKKFVDGFNVIWWIQTVPTNVDGVNKVRLHKRRAIPGVMQHYLGPVPDTCPWRLYSHVFIVVTHKDRDWMVYDNESYSKHDFGHEIYIYALRPMFKDIGEKFKTYIEHLPGAKTGTVPEGYTTKKFEFTELGCKDLCWARKNSCVVYAVYATEFIIKHPERHNQIIMYTCCRNQVVYGLIRAKLDHYCRVKGPRRGQYIEVTEGIWGTDEVFPYQELLDEAMLDESTLANEFQCTETPKQQLYLINERLKIMGSVPPRKLKPGYIELLQAYIDERKKEAILEMEIYIMD